MAKRYKKHFSIYRSVDQKFGIKSNCTVKCSCKFFISWRHDSFTINKIPSRGSLEFHKQATIQQLFRKTIRVSFETDFRYCGKIFSITSLMYRSIRAMPRQHLFYVLFLTIISQMQRVGEGRGNVASGGEIFVWKNPSN